MAMDLKITGIVIAVLVIAAFIFHIVATATDHWILVNPYYEDFLWKGCYKKGNEIGCDRLGPQGNTENYKGGAAMIAMRTVAVNYSLVGEKPYDQVYGGLWQACLVKDGSKTCDDLMVGQGQRINTDWIRTVRAFMILTCCAYLVLIVPPVFMRKKVQLMFNVLGFCTFLPFILGSIGLFVYSGWSDVSLRYKNYYGWSFFLAAFACFFLYITLLLSFIAGCQKDQSMKKPGLAMQGRF